MAGTSQRVAEVAAGRGLVMGHLGRQRGSGGVARFFDSTRAALALSARMLNRWLRDACLAMAMCEPAVRAVYAEDRAQRTTDEH